MRTGPEARAFRGPAGGVPGGRPGDHNKMEAPQGSGDGQPQCLLSPELARLPTRPHLLSPLPPSGHRRVKCLVTGLSDEVIPALMAARLAHLMPTFRATLSAERSCHAFDERGEHRYLLADNIRMLLLRVQRKQPETLRHGRGTPGSGQAPWRQYVQACQSLDGRRRAMEVAGPTRNSMRPLNRRGTASGLNSGLN